MNEPTSSTGSSSSPASHEWRKRELGLAAANAVKLGSSLIVTWGIGLAARLYIPRYLGPDRFGMLNFAEAFSATSLVLVDLGIDTYVRKEISVRPEHANDFVGGVVIVRTLLTLLTFVGMHFVLQAQHCRVDVRNLVYIYGVTQFFIVGNNTSAGLLQAVGRVNEMSALSVIVKVLWAACLISAIAFHLGLWAFALTYTLTEGIKSSILFRLARKYVKFDVRFHPRATWMVIVAALPFFVSGLSSRICDKIGASMLAFMKGEREVGWLGAANGLAGLTMLLAPLVGWVVIPLFARAGAQSKDELFTMVRRALEFILSLSIPVSLVIMLGADVWVSIAFGKAYAPAVTAVRFLAAATVLMYVSIVAFNALAVLNYTWHMSIIGVGGMFINPICNWLLIPFMSSRLGPGGGASASAASTFLTEIGIVVPLFILLGRRGYDRRLLVSSSKNLLCAILVSVLHIMLPTNFGAIRIAIDVIVYACVVVTIGGVDIRQLVRLAKMRSALKTARG